MFSDPFLEYRANVWDTQIRVKSMVGDMPWRIDHGSKKFRLISLDDVSISSTTYVGDISHSKENSASSLHKYTEVLI